MADSIILRFTEVFNKDKNQMVYESQMIQVNGPSGVHIDMEGRGNWVTTLRSMTGLNFVSNYQDYFADISDFFIKGPFIGQAYKVQVNKAPIFGIIMGNIDDLGDPNPDDPNDLVNAFAGSNGDYFMGKDGQYFFGRQP